MQKSIQNTRSDFNDPSSRVETTQMSFNGRRINKLWVRHTTEYDSAIKWNKLLLSAETWMNLKVIMLNFLKSQHQNVIYYMSPFISFLKWKSHRNGEQISVCQVLGKVKGNCKEYHKGAPLWGVLDLMWWSSYEPIHVIKFHRTITHTPQKSTYKNLWNLSKTHSPVNCMSLSVESWFWKMYYRFSRCYH